jgi:hypothetical protein
MLEIKMITEFYSDTITGQKIRNIEIIPNNVWKGFVGIIENNISNGNFGQEFPLQCQEEEAIRGASRDDFITKLVLFIPNFQTYELKAENLHISIPGVTRPITPETLDILDLIQFCYEHISKAKQESYHSCWNHYHLSFNNKETAQKEFKDTINTVFARNQIAFELEDKGIIKRYNPIISQIVNQNNYSGFNATFNEKMNKAINKFFNKDIEIHEEAIEHLWDAFENIKTYYTDVNKKESITKVLDDCADEEKFRKVLETESDALTKIGNDFLIRHHETNRIRINNIEQMDYLFTRLLALINLIIAKVT